MGIVFPRAPAAELGLCAACGSGFSHNAFCEESIAAEAAPTDGCSDRRLLPRTVAPTIFSRWMNLAHVPDRQNGFLKASLFHVSPSQSSAVTDSE